MEKDREHVDEIFTRLFADMHEADLEVHRIMGRTSNPATSCYKDTGYHPLNNDGLLNDRTSQGRLIELRFTDFNLGNSKIIGHYDAVVEDEREALE